MTTIQDRIIKDFRDKWTKAPDYHDPNTHQNYPAKYIERMSSLGFFVNMDEVEQFLIQSIKEVEEETRKEVLENVIIKANNCFVTPKEDNEIQFVDIELFLCFIKHLQSLKREIILSITNKEKQK